MSVEFQEEQVSNADLYTKPTSKITAWFISSGLAKDEAGANKLQVIISVIFLVVAGYLFLSQ